MALIKQNVMGAFTGKVGTLTTYNTAAGNVARIRNNATNVGEGASRTNKQQTNRVRWANLVNFYKVSADWMKKAYEGKKRGLSDYNRMMALNFNISTIALTKQEAAVGSCVIDEYLVTQGSLAPIQVQQQGNTWQTNIRIGSFTIDAETTVGAFARQAIANNAFLRRGMQLSFISYQQDVDDLGFPRCVCTAYELILDPTNDSDLLWSFIPEFGMKSAGGYLCTSDNISIGGFAYILSETKRGTTKVSTQYLIVNNAQLLSTYRSEEHLLEAIASYGHGDTTFLDSNYAFEKEATPQPTYIQYIESYDGKKFNAGDFVGSLQNILDRTRTIQASILMSRNIALAEVSDVWFGIYGGEKFHTKTFNVKDGNIITVNGASTWDAEYNWVVWELGVVIGGVTYVIEFAKKGGVQVVE